MKPPSAQSEPNFIVSHRSRSNSISACVLRGDTAGLREGSRAAHGEKSYEIMDVAAQAVTALHAQSGSDVIIHGHTHRPALHVDGARKRYVLPDWELDEEPVRGGWIAVAADGTITRHDLDGHLL